MERASIKAEGARCSASEANCSFSVVKLMRAKGWFYKIHIKEADFNLALYF